uniref:CASP-like protein n=1 Tax=Leersia perrieri TaxID=77586 RepID=A0A0D9WH93_9ORYZ
MWEVAWRPGTWGGLAMRVGQVAFAGASIGVMACALGFANYTAFCYLIASMGLQSLWSLGLACLDTYALIVKRDLNNALLVTALLSFAASCSAGGVIVLFKKDVLFCRRYPQLPCGRFELAVALAFLSWALSATSAIIMFCLLAAF